VQPVLFNVDGRRNGVWNHNTEARQDTALSVGRARNDVMHHHACWLLSPGGGPLSSGQGEKGSPRLPTGFIVSSSLRLGGNAGDVV
jgi:hypothetical protein